VASTAGDGIGWALADVAVQNGTSFVVVAVCGLSKYCGGSDTKMVIDLQVWVARTIGSLEPIRVVVLRVASKDWLVRWI
jgi:hypothetical protein